MSFLLDTNVVSDVARPRPERAVLAWFEAAADAQLYLSVLSLCEIRKGVDRLPAGARRTRLTAWLEGELPAWFGAPARGERAVAAGDRKPARSHGAGSRPHLRDAKRGGFRGCGVGCRRSVATLIAGWSE